MTARITVYLGEVGDTSRPVMVHETHSLFHPSTVRRWSLRNDHAHSLNWRAMLRATLDNIPFTPYHAESQR